MPEPKRTIRDREPGSSIFDRTAPLDEEPQPAAVEGEKRKRIKRSFYFYPEDIRLLESIQYEAWKRGEPKPELSQLVAEGIKLLAQHNSQTSSSSTSQSTEKSDV